MSVSTTKSIVGGSMVMSFTDLFLESEESPLCLGFKASCCF